MWRWKTFGASAFGSLFCCSIAARFSCCSSSNSFCGNAGSRRISATSLRTSGRLSRIVSTVTTVCVGRPPIETRAFSRSSSSLICWRVCFVVPRISMSAAMSDAVALPVSDFSSPKRRVSAATTVPPRVFFGSRATFMPSGSSDRFVRDSMFAGEGSNASPAAMAASPL